MYREDNTLRSKAEEKDKQYNNAKKEMISANLTKVLAEQHYCLPVLRNPLSHSGRIIYNLQSPLRAVHATLSMIEFLCDKLVDVLPDGISNIAVLLFAILKLHILPLKFIVNSLCITLNSDRKNIVLANFIDDKETQLDEDVSASMYNRFYTAYLDLQESLNTANSWSSKFRRENLIKVIQHCKRMIWMTFAIDLLLLCLMPSAPIIAFSIIIPVICTGLMPLVSKLLSNLLVMICTKLKLLAPKLLENSKLQDASTLMTCADHILDLYATAIDPKTNVIEYSKVCNTRLASIIDEIDKLSTPTQISENSMSLDIRIHASIRMMTGILKELREISSQIPRSSLMREW